MGLLLYNSGTHTHTQKKEFNQEENAITALFFLLQISKAAVTKVTRSKSVKLYEDIEFNKSL